MNPERNELTPPGHQPNLPEVRKPNEVAQRTPAELADLPTPPMGMPVIPPPPIPLAPVPPPPTNKTGSSMWKALWEIPGMKMLVGLVLALALTITGISLFSSNSSNTSGTFDPLQYARGKDLAEVLSSRPIEVVSRLYSAIGNNDASLACAYFDDHGRQKFTADLGYPDCGAALLGLMSKVDDHSSYANSIPTVTPTPPTGNTIRISSCAYKVQGGPSLGAFTLTKIERGLWIITDHENEPNPCPAQKPSTSGTSSGTPQSSTTSSSTTTIRSGNPSSGSPSNSFPN